MPCKLWTKSRRVPIELVCQTNDALFRMEDPAELIFIRKESGYSISGMHHGQLAISFRPRAQVSAGPVPSQELELLTALEKCDALQLRIWLRHGDSPVDLESSSVSPSITPFPLGRHRLPYKQIYMVICKYGNSGLLLAVKSAGWVCYKSVKAYEDQSVNGAEIMGHWGVEGQHKATVLKIIKIRRRDPKALRPSPCC